MQQAALVDLEFRPAAPEDAIAVATEAELRAALAAAALDWGDARVLQLTADIELTSTLVIGSLSACSHHGAPAAPAAAAAGRAAP